MIIVIYGVAFVLVVYFLVCIFYSVYYTPGTNTLYNSPIVQTLFPSSTKLFPTWGYNSLGMYNQPFQFGQGDFWPESGKPYAPNKFGSPGASPSGGMRPSFSIPGSSSVGYWGNTPNTGRDVQLDIYDDSDPPIEYITDVGHW